MQRNVKTIGIGGLVLVVVGMVAYFKVQNGMRVPSEAAVVTATFDQARTKSLEPEPNSGVRASENGLASYGSAGASQLASDDSASASLCLLRPKGSSANLPAFLRRYSRYALHSADAQEIVDILAELNGKQPLLPRYDRSSVLSANVGRADNDTASAYSISGGLTDSQLKADGELLLTYARNTDGRYEYSPDVFDTAVWNFARSFRDSDPTVKRLGLISLYRHVRAAGQYYWRYHPDPGWLDFVRTEQYRQALIYLIQVYGTEELSREIAGDQYLMPPVNAYSGKPSRPYGNIFGPPVVTKRTELIDAFQLSSIEQSSTVQPINFAADERMISYQPASSRLDEIAKTAWGELSSVRLGELLADISTECN